MNNNNKGLTVPFVVIAALIASVLIGALFIPGNAVYGAPFINKLGALILVVGAVYWAKLFAKDKLTLHKHHLVNFFIHLGVLTALLVLALLVLVVWHSGPLGTSLNDI
jgi:hypothetical protein